MISRLSTAERTPLWATSLGVAMLVAVLTLSGCSTPTLEGYQVQAPPDGFVYAVVGKSAGGVLTGRSLVSYGRWLGDIRDNENLSTLEVAGYSGGTSKREVAAAHDAMAARTKQSKQSRVGPLRELQLPDSTAAWGWTEEGDDADGQLQSLKVVAVASYDTVSFSLSFYTRLPERMSEPQLDAVVSSFALGRPIVYWNAVWAALVAAAVLVFLLVRQVRPRRVADYGLWQREEGPKSDGPPHHDESGSSP